MYGKNGRIGLLVPSVNTVAEPEFNQLVPQDVGVYAARLRTRRAVTADSKAMLQHIARAADELGSARVDVLAFACTASSFVEGDAGETALRQRIEQAGHSLAVTTSGAVAAALHQLGVQRLAVATPYLDELNILEKTYLDAEGFEVIKIAGMHIAEAFDIGKVTPQETAEFARSAWHPEADALFISCTNLRTIGVLQDLKEEFGKPVISSNSATCWACLRALGCEDAQADAVLHGNAAALQQLV